jgi:hypothetical protein
MSDKKLSDTILEMGEDFQVDAMHDFDERVESGEFKGKSEEEIRSIYYEEALADEQAQEMDDHFREIEAMEEAAEDAQDFHIPVNDDDDSDEEDEEDDHEYDDDEEDE